MKFEEKKADPFTRRKTTPQLVSMVTAAMFVGRSVWGGEGAVMFVGR